MPETTTAHEQPSPRGRTAARRLAMARFVSVFGSSAASVALSWHLWETTRSSGWVAAAFLSGSLVLGLASLPAGALADRVDRRRLMIASDLAAAACFTLLAIAAWQDASPPVLVLLMALGALAESPFVAASQAAIPNLVDDADLPWANALLSRVQMLVSMVAPAAGGALAGAFGTQLVLGANAVSFLASGLLVASITMRFSVARTAAGDDLAHGPGRGRAVRIAWGDPLLRATIFPGFIAFIGVGFVAVANPRLAESFALDAFGLGLLWSAPMVGALAASFGVRRLLEPGREFRVVVVGLALHGVGLGVVALTDALAAALAGMLVLGVGIGITAPARQTIIQRHSADGVRASLFGLMESIGWISFAISGVAAGAFVDAVGTHGAYALAATLFFAGVVLQLALRAGPRLASPPGTPVPVASPDAAS
jgi:MFS family permease